MCVLLNWPLYEFLHHKKRKQQICIEKLVCGGHYPIQALIYIISFVAHNYPVKYFYFTKKEPRERK